MCLGEECRACPREPKPKCPHDRVERHYASPPVEEREPACNRVPTKPIRDLKPIVIDFQVADPDAVADDLEAIARRLRAVGKLRFTVE